MVPSSLLFLVPFQANPSLGLGRLLFVWHFNWFSVAYGVLLSRVGGVTLICFTIVVAQAYGRLLK